MRKISFILIFLFSFILFITAEDIFSDLPPYELLLPESEITISLDFKDASLKDILKVFSIQSGLNFIASEVVQDRTITLYLDNVPLKAAMDKLFKANNLTYELDKDARIFIVKEWGVPEVETITKIFTLKYASVSTSSLREDLHNYISSGEGKGASSGDEGEGGEGENGTAEKDAGITGAIKKLLSKHGSLIEEPRINSLIITDIPSRFPAIEETIKGLDIPVPLVMLEVEMLDVSKGTVDKLGLKWGDTSSYPSILAMTLTGAKRGTKFPFSAWWPQEGMPDRKGTDYTVPGTINFGTSYQILLQFIKSQTDTRVLARPRILTLNNETAEIMIVTDEVVGTETTLDTETNVQTTTAIRASDYALFSDEMGTGVFLRVTPQINLETGEITMFIYPKVSDTVANTSFSTYRDPTLRSTKSVVRVKDSQTVVIGGLIRYDRSETITKFPFLGDIPWLGGLFRHRSKTKDEERELLVFITPHIIKEDQAQLAKIQKKGTVFDREQNTESGLTRQNLINRFLSNLEKSKKKKR